MKRTYLKGILFALAAALLAVGAMEFQACGSAKTNTQVATLSAPDGLTVTPGDGQNAIAWNLVTGAASYNLYWDAEAGMTVKRQTARVGTKISGINATFYTHTGLTNGTTYYYLVTAVSSAGAEGNASASPVSGTPTASVTCTGADTLCGSSCFDLGNNNANCGTCGNACPSGKSCVAGTCVTPPLVCPSGETNCSGSCQNLKSDRNNCGACGTPCSSSTVCIQGSCGVCPASYIVCNGQCVHPAYDISNCGACGSVCGAGKTCVSGVCQTPSSCPAFYITCGGACVYPASDVNNCGSCGYACGSGAKYCVSGVCS